MTRRLLLLVTGCVAFLVAVGLPARWLAGDAAFLYLATAVGLCLFPALATFFWAEWAFREEPEQMRLMLLGSTGLRMFGVLVAGFLLYQLAPFFQSPAFLLWLAAGYLFTLAWEVTLLVAGRQGARAAGGSSTPAGR